MKSSHEILNTSIRWDLWTWIELVFCFVFSRSAMQSQKTMYALLNKDMRPMWPACCSNSSSQTHKTVPTRTFPSPNVLLKLAEPHVCGLCQGSPTISCSLKGPYQCFCMFQHVAEHFDKDWERTVVSNLFVTYSDVTVETFNRWLQNYFNMMVWMTDYLGGGVYFQLFPITRTKL